MNNVNNQFLPEEFVQSILTEYTGHHVAINNLNLYQKAFVHKSFLIIDRENFAEDGDDECAMIFPQNLLSSNERLEFLGDAVINLVVGEHLYDKFPDKDEGFLTKLRTKIVRSEKLAMFAENLGFRPYLLVSSHIERITQVASGRNNPRFLEDSFESFVGALYKDQKEHGFNVAKKFIKGILNKQVNMKDLIENNDNFKDSLLRYYQSKSWVHPIYQSLSNLNNKEFHIAVTIDTKLISVSDKPRLEKNSKLLFAKLKETLFNKMNDKEKASFQSTNVCILEIGKGNNKKSAEQSASKNALLFLGLSLNY